MTQARKPFTYPPETRDDLKRLFGFLWQPSLTNAHISSMTSLFHAWRLEQLVSSKNKKEKNHQANNNNNNIIIIIHINHKNSLPTHPQMMTPTVSGSPFHLEVLACKAWINDPEKISPPLFHPGRMARWLETPWSTFFFVKEKLAFQEIQLNWILAVSRFAWRVSHDSSLRFRI